MWIGKCDDLRPALHRPGYQREFGDIEIQQFPGGMAARLASAVTEAEAGYRTPAQRLESGAARPCLAENRGDDLQSAVIFPGMTDRPDPAQGIVLPEQRHFPPMFKITKSTRTDNIAAA